MVLYRFVRDYQFLPSACRIIDSGCRGLHLKALIHYADAILGCGAWAGFIDTIGIGSFFSMGGLSAFRRGKTGHWPHWTQLHERQVPANPMLLRLWIFWRWAAARSGFRHYTPAPYFTGRQLRSWRGLNPVHHQCTRRRLDHFHHRDRARFLGALGSIIGAALVGTGICCWWISGCCARSRDHDYLAGPVRRRPAGYRAQLVAHLAAAQWAKEVDD
jgi:hypothetical protein